jgi:hypothetical protein
MDLGFGVILFLAAMTFLLAAVLQCLGLRKQEQLIERLERLQGQRARHRDEPPSRWSVQDPNPAAHVLTRRIG